MTMRSIEQKKAESKVDSEAEKKWKLAEEARQKLESDLRVLREELEKKAVEPRPPTPRPTARIATIYRGLHNIERVRLDFPGTSELPAGQWSVTPETAQSACSEDSAEDRSPPRMTRTSLENLSPASHLKTVNGPWCCLLFRAIRPRARKPVGSPWT